MIGCGTILKIFALNNKSRAQEFLIFFARREVFIQTKVLKARKFKSENNADFFVRENSNIETKMYFWRENSNSS